MHFLFALLIGLFSLIPFFALADDSHAVFYCEFPNAEVDPEMEAVVADYEWSQVVYFPRVGGSTPAKDVWVRLEFIQGTPTAYIWNFVNQNNQSHVRVQEILTDVPHITLLGRKPGTYTCEKINSKYISGYKRY